MINETMNKDMGCNITLGTTKKMHYGSAKPANDTTKKYTSLPNPVPPWKYATLNNS